MDYFRKSSFIINYTLYIKSVPVSTVHATQIRCDPDPYPPPIRPSSFSTGFLRFYRWVLDFFTPFSSLSAFDHLHFPASNSGSSSSFRQHSDQSDKNPLRHRCLPLSVVSRDASSTSLHPEPQISSTQWIPIIFSLS